MRTSGKEGGCRVANSVIMWWVQSGLLGQVDPGVSYITPQASCGTLDNEDPVREKLKKRRNLAEKS